MPPIDIIEQGIYSAPDEDNICLICHDLLVGGEESSDNNPPYVLECKHKYHASCIITWFRSGNMNCPYCGDLGVNAPKEKKNRGTMRRSMRLSWYDRAMVNSKYERLRQYSRRKDSPGQLTKMVEKLKGLEKELKDAKDELRKFTDRPAQQQTWKQMDNERQKLRNRIWATNRKIYGQKCAISSYPVIPLIIPKVVSLQ